ncbi:hypothetical protein [Bacillus halotolerans]|uniref:hypothetical protein n=1 Tax=Bacillus halotolerans TaxID=260554 RepID=UPI002DC055E0|nr:hypothetical protein [Bacillus halotolerans]MEC1648231.1 hypothetical protein [Bacillus halotolerans]
MNRLNKKQLEEIRKRAEAATGGKWVAEVNDGLMDHRTYYRVFSDIETEYSEVTFLVHKLENEEDADFIANARQDIPALLDHIAELEAELKAARYAPLRSDGKEQLRSFIGSSSLDTVSLTDVLNEYKYEGSDEDDNV